jgi:signal transduction histidine kinase
MGSQFRETKIGFDESLLPNPENYFGKELFVFPLNDSFELDGFLSDWREYQVHRQVFSGPSASFSLLLGSKERHFVVSIKVDDSVAIYPTMESRYVADQLEVEFKTAGSEYQKLVLSARGTGQFPVLIARNGELKNDWRYKAFWKLTDSGYNIELKFPSGIKPKEIRVVHNNIDRPQQTKYTERYSSTRYELNPIVWPSSKLVKQLKSIQLAASQRVWLLDNKGRVLASNGKIDADDVSYSSSPLFNWILSNQSEIEADPRENALQLDDEDIYLALKGTASARIENIKNSDVSIAVATYPIVISEAIVGVVLLEENIAKVQVLQLKTLIRMFVIILSVFLLIMWIIFWYVSRVVTRIKRLNESLDASVDSHGRINRPLDLVVDDGDEIDDLTKAFSQMGTRLFEYNDHLEKLASRLSHELRTPIAIVRSSLDNLLLNCEDNEEREIIDRALAGSQRLGEIITRMRRASGVKQAMQTADTETIEVISFVSQLVKGYQHSFTDSQFEFRTELNDFEMRMSADLFTEMLDKLVANAMDFSENGSTITVSFYRVKNKLRLSVENYGQVIEKKNLKKIFHSLVSIRTSQQSGGANLGLGLYVVRLIAEFHGATAKAKNKPDQNGVEMLIDFSL